METYLSELEQQVVKNIISSEYMDADGEQMIGWSVWSFSVTNGKKNLAGAIGSLVKKGIVCCDSWGTDEEVCSLTADGYNWARNNKLV